MLNVIENNLIENNLYCLGTSVYHLNPLFLLEKLLVERIFLRIQNIINIIFLLVVFLIHRIS